MAPAATRLTTGVNTIDRGVSDTPWFPTWFPTWFPWRWLPWWWWRPSVRADPPSPPIDGREGSTAHKTLSAGVATPRNVSNAAELPAAELAPSRRLAPRARVTARALADELEAR